ncbi:nitroreductase family deazaflavin-dependent oxidoreductase [Nocardioides mesophilus]|uniref:Nitroreductase family deazaflavin-dependent oxidoreductase n=1 Tax=Nocardioides mesophilus TaxID=433659 RepID=A0A7G9RAY1_9ACTN|nr:nitroreductase family deazaflavin-dependent oxidoreductase [Nocardioides mesophilus]QNN52756.1 nitroreductase family deazaflavin-dependent oxidoreductase [Nocardioides mesophilus]
MSVADEMDYRFGTANRAQRALQVLVASRGGAWFFSRVLPPLDTWVQRVSHHRHTVPGLLAGLPVVDLTTTGRKSGLPRTTHLIAIPHHDTLALLGTNFGQPSTPAWVLNLEADPVATLSYRGTSVQVLARPATEPEQAEVLARSEKLYIGYRKYQTRITGRRLRIFVLEQARS